MLYILSLQWISLKIFLYGLWSAYHRLYHSQKSCGLGLHLDNKLNWKDHIIKKRKQMDLRHKELCWLFGTKSHLSVDNKLLLYKSIMAPIWTCGIELWGCACKSNNAVIQRCQSKILRAIVDAPQYVTNDMIHKGLGIPTVQEVIHERSSKHLTNLESHSNPLLQTLPRNNAIRRLKEGGQLTCNTFNDLSLEGTSSH
jgi:hypothetical protein